MLKMGGTAFYCLMVKQLWETHPLFSVNDHRMRATANFYVTISGDVEARTQDRTLGMPFAQEVYLHYLHSE